MRLPAPGGHRIFHPARAAASCRLPPALAFMEIRPALIHIAAAVAVGALISAFTPVRWIAASLWVSSAMIVNGAIATVEDARPGGFENPEGTSPIRGASAIAVKGTVLALALAGLGFAVQFHWLSSP